MSIAEIVAAYKKIIESLTPLLDHRLADIRLMAQIQISRCERTIRELENTSIEI